MGKNEEIGGRGGEDGRGKKSKKRGDKEEW